MKKQLIIIYLCFISVVGYSQNTVKGTFPAIANQQIKLVGFNGFQEYTMDSVKTDEHGNFTLSYGASAYGMGYLSVQDNKPFYIVLERLTMKGESFAITESLEIMEGYENKLLGQYTTEYSRREGSLAGWDYLQKIYARDLLFSNKTKPKKAIDSERQRIKTEDKLFLDHLPQNSYLSYYLPLRKLVSSVGTIAQYRTEEIPATMAAFRAIDYTDPRMPKSGLLKDIIFNHFWLIENSGRSLDSVAIEMNKSIDIMVKNLVADKQLLNAVSDHLYNLLEKRSLFKSAEYLALKLLNEQGSSLNAKLAAQLENYRAMKPGNMAHDFDFETAMLAPGYEASKQPKKLSDLTNKYILVVFGESWSKQCTPELLKLYEHYDAWKKRDIEVVFVSLDENEQQFKNYVISMPFISVCDYQKWNSPIVKSYHVFTTPTMYLLTNKREILVRPNSVAHLEAWLKWYDEGNKLTK